MLDAADNAVTGLVMEREARTSTAPGHSPGWRPMEPEDLEAVHALGTRVHPGYPERIEVFRERLRLYPEGCHVLERDGELLGYVISHPWHPLMPPKLDSLVTAMPTFPATFYIHDLALLPAARGTGAGAGAVSLLVGHAQAIGLTDLSLVAVNASVPFWKRQGFDVVVSETIAAILRSYDDEARFMIRKLAVPASDFD